MENDNVEFCLSITQSVVIQYEKRTGFMNNKDRNIYFGEIISQLIADIAGVGFNDNPTP